MIGIIVPFYKNEAFIHRCLDSILAQTYKDFRLFLVDDGSPDRCGEICDEYAESNSNIVVFHQHNQGLSAARNIGLEAALSDTEVEWVTFVDGDDWVHREYLETLFKIAVDNHVQISTCCRLQTGGNVAAAKIDGTVVVKDPDSILGDVAVAFYPTVVWGKLYKKNIIGDVRFPVGIYHEDEYTTYKWLTKVDRIAFTESQLYFYFINPDGFMHSQWSSKRLDSFDGLLEQLHLYQDQNYSKAFARYKMFFIRNLESNVISSEGNKDAIKIIKEKYQVFQTSFGDSLSTEEKKRLNEMSSFKRFRFKKRMVEHVEQIKKSKIGVFIRKVVSQSRGK